MEVSARIVTLELAQRFVISRESQDTADVVQVDVRRGDRSFTLRPARNYTSTRTGRGTSSVNPPNACRSGVPDRLAQAPASSAASAQ